MATTGRLAGKKALITGGAQGLGYAFAKMFAEEGADVVVSDIQGDKVRGVAEELGLAAGLSHDVRSEAEWDETLKAANDAMGGISVLIHNAGIGPLGSIEDETLESYRNVMATDCDSVFIGTKAALPYLRESQPASIVVISSVAGLRASPVALSYNTAKAGVTMMTKSIASYCGKMRLQITCNSVHPVFIRTPIIEPVIAMHPTREAGEKALTRGIALRRIGEPEEVASMVTYLASDEAKFVTGGEFVIDGGRIIS